MLGFPLRYSYWLRLLGFQLLGFYFRPKEYIQHVSDLLAGVVFAPLHPGFRKGTPECLEDHGTASNLRLNRVTISITPYNPPKALSPKP